MTEGPWRFVHEPLLGTVVVVDVHGPDDTVAAAADRAVVTEIRRLQAIFDVYDPTSELARWKRGAVRRPSHELCTVLAAAEQHRVVSGGRFNPAVGVLVELWRDAARAGVEPSDARLAAASAAIARPGYRVVDGDVVIEGDVAAVDLNAFVKGWIVDRTVEVATATVGDVDGIVVNAGGDLRHHGGPPLVVGVENPLRPYDNEPPIDVITLQGAGLATSGRARRGHQVGDRWYAHVIDPRTGRPVDGVASITVVAADTATADVTATVLGVIPPADAIREADTAGLACLVVGADGTVHASRAWKELRR